MSKNRLGGKKREGEGEKKEQKMSEGKRDEGDEKRRRE